MSPALIDSRSNPLIEGQISSPNSPISSSEISRLVSSLSMNPSGFGNSGEIRPEFEFNSRVTAPAKPDPHTPIFSTSSGLSRPRTAKHRNSALRRPMGGSETRKIDPGLNPFRPVPGYISRVSYRLESDHSADDHIHNPFNLKFSSNKVEEVGGGLIDDISKLRIDNQGLSGNRLPSELSNDLKKLNLASSNGESSKIPSAKQDTFGSQGQNVGGLYCGTPLASELPNDLKKLNLKDTTEVNGGNFVLGASTSTSSRDDFVFGGNRKNNDTVSHGIASTLPDKIKNMNIGDYDKTKSNANQSYRTFDSSNRRTGTSSGGVIDPMILDEIENLRIGDHSEASSDHAKLNSPSGNVSKEVSEKSNSAEFMSEVREQGKHSSGPEVAEDKSDMGSELRQPSATSTTSVPSNSSHLMPPRDEFQIPFMNGVKAGFSFDCKRDGVNMPHFEFRTQDSESSLFGVTNEKMEFSAKSGSVKDTLSREKDGKPKEPASVLMSLGREFVSEQNSFQHDAEPSDPCSPMDFSPYQEIQDDEHSPREPSLTRENQPSNVSHTTFSSGPIDEDLVKATESMDINKDNDEVKVQVSECFDHVYAAMENSADDSFCAVETESFMTASENFNRDGEIKVESNGEVQSSDQTQYFSTASSASSGGSAFTFAASSSSQSQASATMRHNKKKNPMKSSVDMYIPSRTSVLSDAISSSSSSSSSQFSPRSRISMLIPPVRPENSAPNVPQKGSIRLTITSSTSKTIGGSNLEDTKKEVSLRTTAARIAQEACENWRLRGNQAYSNGKLETAENYYTQGLGCISRNEASKDCLRALALCYSNRAATRMSLGRMRDALRDCLLADEIDPNFFKVQLRAANCYLALGEVGDASQNFKKLFHSTNASAERTLILEASDGLQKAQKLSECMNLSAKLLQRRSLTDVETALGVITEALVISPYSEQLLAHKAEALFMLRKYEEVIQLCEQTLEAAEKNTHFSDANGQSTHMETSDPLKNYSFRIWRYSLIFKSNFYLGKLEEAFNFLEKQEKWRSIVEKYGNETVEPLIPQLSTARELMRHKSAGNTAFQGGRHREAVEHYSAALSFKVESRPFAAVCFGNRAAAYQALGQITDAIADCSLAIALDGNYLKAISRRAVLFEKIRDYEQAAKDTERLVSVLTKQAEGKANQMGASLPTSSLADLRQARQRLYQMEEQARKGIPLNFYLILGVEPSVSAADLKKAYHKAALKHHPDKAGQSLARSEGGDDGLWKEIAEEVYRDADRLFKMIGEAYGVLSDPSKRAQYDIEEETRNGQKRSTLRVHTDGPHFTTDERSGGVGQQWREGWRSSATNPYARGFEPTRSNRYY